MSDWSDDLPDENPLDGLDGPAAPDPRPHDPTAGLDPIDPPAEDPGVEDAFAVDGLVDGDGDPGIDGPGFDDAGVPDLDDADDPHDRDDADRDDDSDRRGVGSGADDREHGGTDDDRTDEDAATPAPWLTDEPATERDGPGTDTAGSGDGDADADAGSGGGPGIGEPAAAGAGDLTDHWADALGIGGADPAGTTSSGHESPDDGDWLDALPGPDWIGDHHVDTAEWIDLDAFGPDPDAQLGEPGDGRAETTAAFTPDADVAVTRLWARLMGGADLPTTESGSADLVAALDQLEAASGDGPLNAVVAAARSSLSSS